MGLGSHNRVAVTDASHAAGSLLRVRDLSVSYSPAGATPHTAIDQINFEVNSGECLGLMGASGCGKTTIALALLQVLPVKSRVSGSIRIRDRELIGLSEREMDEIRGAEISMIFQEPNLALNPVMRIGTQVAEVIRAHKRSWSGKKCVEQAQSLLEAVRLSGNERFFDAYPHQLSGGQRQRVLIAQALACQPAIVVADEPTASLDWAVQAEILDLLAQLRDRFRMALLLISHDPRVLARLASRVLVMHDGRIVEEGEWQQLPKWAMHAYTRELLASGLWRGDDPASGVLSNFRSTRSVDLAPGSFSAAGSIDEQSLIEARNVHKLYSRRQLFSRKRVVVPALRDLSLRVARGGAVGLVGPSGSGKSTLARCLAMLTRPDAGEIWLAGENLTRMPNAALRRHRRRIQLIFQDPVSSINPGMRAWQAVSEPLTIESAGTQEERRERALAMMEQVGLSRSQGDRLPAEFSGGQRQRLAIARALILEPEFMIFDEAFSGLDRLLQAQLSDLLRELRANRGLTYLFITHDLELAARVADEIAVLRDGQIVARSSRGDSLLDRNFAEVGEHEDEAQANLTGALTAKEVE